MEPIGLVVGVAGLAGLFSVCLDVIEKIHSYKDADVDSRSLEARFEADKLLFRKWGRTVGIDNGRLADEHHMDLDDSETAEAVAKVLSSIRELELNANRALPMQATKGDLKAIRDSLLPGSYIRYQKAKEISSKRKRVAWAFGTKVRYISDVTQFGDLVQSLYRLVPPTASKQASADVANIPIRVSTNLYLDPYDDGFASLGSLHSDLADRSTWRSNLQRILLEEEKRVERKVLDPRRGLTLTI